MNRQNKGQMGTWLALFLIVVLVAFLKMYADGDMDFFREKETLSLQVPLEENSDERLITPQYASEGDEDIILEEENLVNPDSLTQYYGYKALEEPEQSEYINMLNSIINMDSYVSELDVDAMDRVFNVMLNDHPELFYIGGYQYKTGVGQPVTFIPNYTMDAEAILENQEKLKTALEKFDSGMPEYTDEYDKVKYAYDYIIKNTEYNTDAPNNQNILSVFLDGESVCQGYAKAFQYLLQSMDIECMLVTGQARESHAWNLVNVNDQYYYVDATWGDASYTNSTGSEIVGYPEINYDYFLVTTKEISITHTVDELIKLPVCTAVTDNYYHREGWFLSEYNEDDIKLMFDYALASDEGWASIKCGNLAVYRMFIRKMIDDQGIFDMIGRDVKQLSYLENEDLKTISFYF